MSLDISTVELQDALERISKITSFRACYFDDPELEGALLHGSRVLLEFDFKTRTYTLFTPLATVKQNIIKAAAEIEARERLIAETAKKVTA